jgi:hypothetical protein
MGLEYSAFLAKETGLKGRQRSYQNFVHFVWDFFEELGEQAYRSPRCLPTTAFDTLLVQIGGIC